MNFTKWLKDNASILRGRSPENVIDLAVACGFSVQEITEGLAHGYRDLQTRTTYKQREDYFVGRELKQADAHCGRVNLEAQWYALAKKERWDIDFEDAA